MDSSSSSSSSSPKQGFYIEFAETPDQTVNPRTYGRSLTDKNQVLWTVRADDPKKLPSYLKLCYYSKSLAERTQKIHLQLARFVYNDRKKESRTDLYKKGDVTLILTDPAVGRFACTLQTQFFRYDAYESISGPPKTGVRKVRMFAFYFDDASSGKLEKTPPLFVNNMASAKLDSDGSDLKLKPSKNLACLLDLYQKYDPRNGDHQVSSAAPSSFSSSPKQLLVSASNVSSPSTASKSTTSVHVSPPPVPPAPTNTVTANPSNATSNSSSLPAPSMPQASTFTPIPWATASATDPTRWLSTLQPTQTPQPWNPSGMNMLFNYPYQIPAQYLQMMQVPQALSFTQGLPLISMNAAATPMNLQLPPTAPAPLKLPMTAMSFQVPNLLSQEDLSSDSKRPRLS